MRWSLLIAVAIACSPTPKEQPTKASASGDAPKPAPTNGAKVLIATPTGEVSVDVEVVSTEGTIERGLMYRQFMAPEAGMLFLLGVDKEWTFWMRNTLIPLDMIFIARDMTIAGIVENAEPRTETLRVVNAPSLYVLEVNGGYCAAHKVTAGAKVRFDGVPPR
ncbi:MAG TPA: DUF192 domain-containing protein [Kofleriaceae bacterium]